MIDLKDLSEEELQTKAGVLAEDIVKIRASIEKAQATAAETGIYADRDWFHKAKYAKSMKGLEHQAVLHELSRRRKARAVSVSRGLGQTFYEVAKRQLPPELFAELEAESRELYVTLVGAE